MIPAIKTTVQRDPKIFDRKAWGQILKKSWLKTMDFWHRFLLKKHFTDSGGLEYRFQPREGESGNSGQRKYSQTYIGQKEDKYGHTNPLQLTGKTKRQAMAVMDARPKQSGGDLVLHVPYYIYLKPYAKSPAMASELSAISFRDIDKLVKILDSSITQEVQNQKRR